MTDKDQLDGLVKVFRNQLFAISELDGQALRNTHATSLNELFFKLLSNFTLNLDSELLKLIRQQAVATFNQLFKGEEEAYVSLTNQYTELKKKMDRLEERYIEEEINSELYNKFYEKYKSEKWELERKLLNASKKSSNLGDCIDISLEIASKMAEKWVLIDYVSKQKIQSLVFPEGITFSINQHSRRLPVPLRVLCLKCCFPSLAYIRPYRITSVLHKCWLMVLCWMASGYYHQAPLN